MDFLPGIYPIYKPKGPTSFDVVAKLRSLTGIKKIGHAGTLDPLAEGVVVVAVGRDFTKHLDQLVQADKEYLATVKLGQTSTTDDEQGEKEINEINPENIPSQQQILQTLNQFIGKIEQVPPAYSSIKIQGQPAHRRVRKGQSVELAARQVEIFSIELLEYDWPELKIKVHCGKGVYIRSLARDIGATLQTGGYLTSLIRTRVGKYTFDKAIHLPNFS